MDIQISSNFERYLFDLLGRNHEQLNQYMYKFNENGKFSVTEELHNRAKQDFSAYRLNDDQISNEIQKVYQSTGEIIDPHSVIGVAAAKLENDTSAPTVVLGTAHPAKFPDAVKNAINVDVALPEYLSDLMDRPEKMEKMNNNLEEIKQLIDRY